MNYLRLFKFANHCKYLAQFEKTAYYCSIAIHDFQTKIYCAVSAQ